MSRLRSKGHRRSSSVVADTLEFPPENDAHPGIIKSFADFKLVSVEGASLGMTPGEC
jgi:hypothetical protein